MMGRRGLVLLVCSALLGGCEDRGLPNQPPCCGAAWSIPQSAHGDLDVLFVIDNAGSMEAEQDLLRQGLPALLRELSTLRGELPNLHIGVTSADLGTGAFPSRRCDDTGGDSGRLLKPVGCANPVGVNYIVDVEPEVCEIRRDGEENCVEHSCEATHCAHEPSTTLEVDAVTGCPRCRNYSGQALEEVYSCLSTLGATGCGIGQPLEAMRLALDPATVDNEGFLREDAALAILIVGDDDDCSASNPWLFQDCHEPYSCCFTHAFSPYSCFQYGVLCDVNDRHHRGLRQDCVPWDNLGALLHPVSDYVDFLTSLKDRQLLVVASIAGPVTPSASGEGVDVTVGQDDWSGWPVVQYSCSTGSDGATPGVRLQAFIKQLSDAEDLSWAYSSVCDSEYSPALEGLGNKLRGLVGDQCLPAPLEGCADPGAELGMPVDNCADNDVCLPTCEVVDVFERGLETELRSAVPACLEVCADGLCPGNNDRNLAYAAGHPDLRDANLPVSACWHISYQANCPDSNFAEILIARRDDPPPRSFAEVACRQIEPKELLCNDGVDNDEDCMVDGADPVCLGD